MQRSSKGLGTIVRAVRDDLGWTQKTLAERMDVCCATVNYWERGKTVPTRMTFALLHLLLHDNPSVTRLQDEIRCLRAEKERRT
jgi:DNA-binding transcriptional regulator YiaG